MTLAAPTPPTEQEACEILIARFNGVIAMFHSKDEDTVFPVAPADIEPLLEVREAPKVVTGTYEQSDRLVRDLLEDYCGRRMIQRNHVLGATVGVIGSLAHLLEYLLRNGCAVYSGRRADKRPEFYVGLTTTCTYCVAVSYRDLPLIKE